MSDALRILANLDDADLIWLRDAGEFRRIPPGETLIKVGRTLYDIFIVLEGEVAVLLTDGRRVATLTVGDVVGEMSFVEGRPPQTTVAAIADTRVLAVRQDAIRARFAQDPGFEARFQRALSLFLSSRLRTSTAGGSLPPAGVRDEGLMRLIALLEGD